MDEVFVEGKTFDHKDTIKDIKVEDHRVFKWDMATKTWRAKVHDYEIDDLAEEVRERTHQACKLRVVT